MNLYDIAQKVRVHKIKHDVVLIAMSTLTVEQLRRELVEENLTSYAAPSEGRIKIAGAPVMICQEIPLGEAVFLTECV